MIRGELTIGSDLTEVARARDWVSALAHQAGLSSQESYELQLVLSEACTNSIKHAYFMEKGRIIKLSATLSNDQICIVVRDFGKKIDLLRNQRPNLETPPENGYGLSIMYQLMDEVRFNLSHSEGTELTLIRYGSMSKNYRHTS
ncbi:MAG: ATP-binding protein [Thermodesulfobacteriota bacterium]|nr:ATP-binding protein [Thermodesulfobacteriota bacterium]